MRFVSSLFRAGTAALVLALTGCNQLEKLDATGGSDGGDVPPDVRAAFERSCGNSPACHAAGGQSPTLEGAGIAGVIGSPSNGSALPLVTLGDTSNSYIAIKMLPDDVIAGLGATRTGGRMPLAFDYATGSADTLADTQVILAWIGGATFPGGGGETAGESTGDPTTGDPTGGGPPTFTRVQDEIFKLSCSCHLAAANGPLNGNLSLLADEAYANIVNVKSMEATTTNFITPNDPAASYLYLKLTGEFLDVEGGAPDAMPLGGAMLSADKLKLVEDWILAGAMDD